MTRPRIGITCDLSEKKAADEPRKRDLHLLKGAYVESVRKAGGIPLLLPSLDDHLAALSYLDAVDALIISGGGHDIDPRLYGEKIRPGCGRLNPKRSEFEIAICREALSRDMPLLGICGGIQVLNVAAGGTLIQDTRSEVKHSLPHRPPDEKASYTFHEIDVFPSCLEETIGAGPHTVNSSHHQAVRELAPGFRLTARSADGIVEGIESNSHCFVLGVQWHPEAMSAYGLGHAVTAEHLLARLIDEAGDHARDPAGRIT